MYALNIDETTGRVLSATYEEYAPENQPKVEELPEGDLSNYKFVDGEFVLDAIQEAQAQQTIAQRIAQNEADIAFIAMMADIEL